MSIQAVFFDMGGTIETFRHDREYRLNAVPEMRHMLSSSGINLDMTDEEFLDFFTAQYQKYHTWRKQTFRELPTWKIWTDFILEDYPEYHDAVKEISEEITLYYESQFYLREMRPEMPAVLDTIQQMGLKIGVISNVTSKGMVPGNLEKYGIRHYFDPVVLSSMYGWRKPDPAIFHYTARLAKVPTSQCVYVGDLISRDVIGAKRAGYQVAVQIRHDFSRAESGDEAKPDYLIESMTELVDILKEHRKKSYATPPDPEIRAFVFDAGDILYHRPSSGQQFKEFLKSLAISQSGSHGREKKILADLAYQGQLSQDEFYEGIVRSYGITQCQQIELGKQILASASENVQIMEGVPQTLAALKKMGYLLGIITDTATPVSNKLRWFEKAGFGSVWDSIISSREVGIRKPNQDIYNLSLEQLGVEAKQAVFVGHSAHELRGARAAGMKTIAFNYDKLAKADVYIKKFADLLEVPLIAAPAQVEAKESE